MASNELNRWLEAKSLMTSESEQMTLGPYFTHLMKQSPRRLLHMLSYYKFAAKMIGPAQRVLEVGCSEGIGAPIFAEGAQEYVGIDIDANAIDWAKRSMAWLSKCNFICGDFLEEQNLKGNFDGVACFDVIEHIFPENADRFLSRLSSLVKPGGTLIVGTPSLSSDQYANEHTRRGHVNLYSGERLKESVQKQCGKTVVFSANDEMVHTGYWPMAHYYLAVGIKST